MLQIWPETGKKQRLRPKRPQFFCGAAGEERNMLKKCLEFAKAEVVLCAAAVLAVVSAFLVPPDSEYLGYIDWDTLALLFSLMAVMTGFQRLGLFDYLGTRFLKYIGTSRQLLILLVLLPFVFSMVITNDVALITFVPFGMVVLQMAGQQRLVVPLVVLQTAAANLGSMLTPMGNPQNLYLYNQSGLGALDFVQLMLPYAAASGLCLLVLAALCPSQHISRVAVPAEIRGLRGLLCCCAGFGLCLLCIAKVLPALAVAAVTAVFLLVFNRKLLAAVDYSLLGTFVAFFVFIGNMGRMESFRAMLGAVLEGHEVITAVAASQVISNVPAALLLSGFTHQWEALIIGCNLGGLGTLLASMASLISYKQIAKRYPEKKGVYFFWFTLCNVGLLAALLGLWTIL